MSLVTFYIRGYNTPPPSNYFDLISCRRNNLVLTRRKDVQIISFEKPEDAGLDLLVQVPKSAIGLFGIQQSKLAPEVTFLAGLGVQVMATSDPLKDEATATAYANKHWIR